MKPSRRPRAYEAVKAVTLVEDVCELDKNRRYDQPSQYECACCYLWLDSESMVSWGALFDVDT
jgi:hypothetical protein